MSFIKEVWNKIVAKGSYLIGKVNWKTKRVLTEAEILKVQELLKDNYYIILTRHNGRLTAYAISIAHFLITGKRGHYGHALLNIEDEVITNDDFKFIESVNSGVKYSTFEEVFDKQVGSVVLLKPRLMTIEKWTGIIDKARSELGKPYDLALDITTDDALNCVELVRNALKSEDNYEVDYARLEAMIKKYKTLDPQMIYLCEDFEIVYEIRK